MTRKSRPHRMPSRGRANLTRLRRVTDAEIEATSPKELAGLTEDFWAQTTIVTPVPKRAISLRVDEDVLVWFKAAGPRYQSRMNAVLRSYMTHARKRRRGAA